MSRRPEDLTGTMTWSPNVLIMSPYEFSNDYHIYFKVSLSVMTNNDLWFDKVLRLVD